MSGHKTVIERVSELEKAFPRLVDALSDNMNRRFEPILPLLNALTDIVGRESVMAKIKELKDQQATQEMEMRKAQLEALVKEGRLVKAETIKDGSVLVAQEKTPDGKLVHPGRFQMMFAEIAPVFQEKLLGKPSVGTVIDLPDNQGTFEVLEAYDFVPPSAVATTPEVPAAVESPATT